MRRILIAVPLFVFTALLSFAQESDPKGKPDETETFPAARVKATKKWTVLYKHPPKAGEPVPVPEEGPIIPLRPFDLTGPDPGDPFRFGNFHADSDWAVSRFGLTPLKEKNAAALVAEAGDFDLEGNIFAEGTGGWFMLFGWKDGHGYMLYNVTLKESGSPWLLCEFRGNKAIVDTHRELARHHWKGFQPTRLSVAKNTLQLDVGNTTVIKDVPLPNYNEGGVIVGTYDTKYGPKPLRIQSLRIKAR